MSGKLLAKYPAEFYLEFRSVDRFLYRVSDLYTLGQDVGKELLARLHDCHLYVLGKRPRLTIVPGSVHANDKLVRFAVEYRIDGEKYRDGVEIPREQFLAEERSFEASPYPHRELISRNDAGSSIVLTILANLVHLMPSVQQKAKDLEVVYIGKGLCRSAQDRLAHHSKLQEILAQIHSNEPDTEVFALVYAFDYIKPIIFVGVPAENTGPAARQRREKVMAYKPSLAVQVSLVEAACISYFKPEPYNIQYLDFPNQKHQILNAVRDADFAAILVQLDNTNIGGQRIYSATVAPSSTHHIVVDFRRIENRKSFLPPQEGPVP
jgi:hypothetical protein